MFSKNLEKQMVVILQRISGEFIEAADIQQGSFDNVGECKYSIPSHWDIGKVYKRLIIRVSGAEDKDRMIH